jgi:carbonic anhydrase
MDGEGVNRSEYEFIGAWVSIAASARERVMRELAGEPEAVKSRACEQGAIRLSLENLMSFPWIRERVEAGAMELHGWYFDIDAGELLAYSPKTTSFAPLVAPTGPSATGPPSSR